MMFDREKLAFCAFWAMTSAAFCGAEFPDNYYVTMKFDDAGRVWSLVEHETKRELIARPCAFVTVWMPDGREIEPVSCEKRCVQLPGNRGENHVVFTFPDGLGEADFAIIPFSAGWEIRLDRMTVKDADYVEWGRFFPSCRTYAGTNANMFSDDASAVCLRSFDLPLMMYLGSEYRKGDTLRVGVERKHGAFVGCRSGLVACPRKRLVQSLRTMTSYAGVPHSFAGGAWAGEAELNRSSYMFCRATPATVEEWIDLALRGGCTTLLYHGWMESRGHNRPDPKQFPNGLEDLRIMSERIHAAGLRCGIHTLTGLIDAETTKYSKQDDWIAPVCDSRLKVVRSYTLAEPLAPDSAEIVVNEEPWDKHDRVFTYGGYGNTFFLDGELIQYSDIRREKPYAFLKLKRGAFGTRKNAGTVPAGTRIDFLRSRYGGFYPDPDSTLADELGDCYAKTFETCKMDMFYFDGSEGCGDLYDIAKIRKAIFSKFDWRNRPIVTEASCSGAHNWWIRSRSGTFDYPYWAPKRFHDYHITSRALRTRQSDLLEPQMGWWEPRRADSWHRAIFTDEMEYFAAKNAGIDAAMSCEEEKIWEAPLAFWPERMITLLGWYEYFRLARTWAPGVQDELAKLGEETVLRQDDDGVWRIRAAAYDTHRIPAPTSKDWTVKVKADCEATLRVEALYGADEARACKTPAFAAADLPNLKQDAANGVTLTVRKGSDEKIGDFLALRADNANKSANGAWARVQRVIPFPYGIKFDGKGGADAYGLWVLGDGSGALLNLQFENAREYTKCYSDHCVKLDFKGWRYMTFLLRERDCEATRAYRWPYQGDYEIYRYAFYPVHCCAVNLYLNGVPAGGRTQVAVSDVKPMPTVKHPLEKPVVTVNGKTFTLPFERMEAGDFAELEDGFWIRYSENGDPLARVKAAEMPVLKAGDNALSFTSANGGRAEVTVVQLGKKRPALRTLAEKDRGQLAYEAAFPDFFAPAKGFSSLRPIAVRPGERARLQLFMVGRVKNPTFAFPDGTRVTFPVTLEADDRFACRDGVHWNIRAKDLSVKAEGALSTALPTVSGRTDVVLTSDDGDAAEVRVSFVKRYPRPGERIAKPTATTKVQFWFDTEDYTFAKSNDGLRDLAKTLTEEGVRGHFNVAGYLARFIQDERRTDVIEALRPHLVGSQSLYHTVHPNITEMTDLADYDAAYHLALAEEAETVGLLRGVLGHDKMWFSVWPGPGSSYVACDVAADLGMPFCGGMEAIGGGRAQQIGHCWFQNQHHVAYNGGSLEDLFPGRFEELDVDKVLDEAATHEVVAFSMHPHFINRPRSWDVDCYAYGNNVTFGRFFDTEAVPDETTAGFFRNLRAFIRRIRSDPRFEFVDCEQLAAEEKPRRRITRRDIPAIRAALRRDFGPISAPASWCVADVFQAAVKLLRGEEEHLPGRVYGFLEKPFAVTEPVTVRADALLAAAKTIAFVRHLAPSYDVGGVTIGPADFLFAALDVLETGAAEVTVEPRDPLGNLKTENPTLAEFSHLPWIFTPDFKDEYLADRSRYQYWTLRYE